MQKKHVRLGWLLPAILALGLLALITATAYVCWERPPAFSLEAPEEAIQTETEQTPAEPDSAPAAEPGLPASGSARLRQRGVYTLLLAGRDDGSGNTDTILFGRLDTAAHRLDLVSVPRDTLVNLDWKVRKLNAVYQGTANSGGTAAEGLRGEMRKLCGFSPDCYLVVDLDVFVEAVDLIGGVEFELPQDMHYDDDAQDLHIHLPAGQRRLNGEEAMGLVRFRTGYLNGDLDRVAVQQQFMEAALGQLLSLGSVPRMPELVTLLTSHTDTDLSAANIAWLVRQVLQCKREDIRFHTAPSTPADVAGLSYTLIEPQPWLSMINDRLNPYTRPIRTENLDLVYRDAAGFHATSGVLRGAGYYAD